MLFKCSHKLTLDNVRLLSRASEPPTICSPWLAAQHEEVREAQVTMTELSLEPLKVPATVQASQDCVDTWSAGPWRSQSGLKPDTESQMAAGPGAP